MKRNLFVITALFLGVIILMLLSDIITIGEKIHGITNLWYTEYIFYAILGVIFIYFILYPLLKILFAPEISGFANGLKSNDIRDLKNFGYKLVKNCYYIPDKNVRNTHSKELKEKIDTLLFENKVIEVIEKEIKLRLEGNADIGVKGINNQIVEYATTVFMVTAISPNSKVDAFSSLVLNFTMMKNLILSAGFRPTKAQLWRLYFRILVTALLSFTVSEALKDAGGIRPFEFLDDANLSETTSDVEIDSDADSDSFSFLHTLSKAKIPGAIVGPVLDGISNALMTLRIGYVTRSYLKEGQNLFFDKVKSKEIKREALKESFQSLPRVLANGTVGMSEGVKKVVLWYCGRSKKN